MMNQTVPGHSFTGRWNYPTPIVFAPGEVERLPDHCVALGIKNPLLVTDSALAGLPFFRDWLTRLENAGFRFRLFSDVKPNPTGTNVQEGVNVLRQHHCDGVVTIGGGSGLDAGKAIAVMAHQTIDLFDLEDVGDNFLRADETAMVPCIAIPTTAGTGSEVGRASVIVDEQVKVKKIIFHPRMLPGLVIADPQLTFGLPAHLTAATGMDAFIHSFEALSSPGFHPMADGIAVEGMRLIWQWLETACQEPDNLPARSQMLVASSMGATAFQKGLGAVHALAHPLGALYDKHHGLLNAILLPYVVQANRRAIEDKVCYLGRCLGIGDHSFAAFFESLLDWRQRLGIPATLADIGIDGDEADKVAAMAIADPSAGGNPIPFAQGDYQTIFLAAVEGRIQ
ncbi:MAG: iron-containing alcohol dehydrogenase [Ketobacteraceae bacterium]|nr:iron-containing alcohol dehydrogenase [Ketobacteraceae bacterium]